MCNYKEILKKGIKTEVKNGSRMKMLMHTTSFWVFIIFHKCVYK